MNDTCKFHLNILVINCQLSAFNWSKIAELLCYILSKYTKILSGHEVFSKKIGAYIPIIILRSRGVSSSASPSIVSPVPLAAAAALSPSTGCDVPLAKKIIALSPSLIKLLYTSRYQNNLKDVFKNPVKLQMAKYLKFLNGYRMPSVGLGTYGLTGESCKRTVDEALSLGYRHFDTAVSYRNEKDIGETLCLAQKQDRIQREDVFITTKIPSIYLSPEDVKYCVRESLDNLKVTYLDLLLIHNPWGLRNKGDGNFKPVNDEGQLTLSIMILPKHGNLWKIW
ncbi:hypothetical protein KUTeg_012517 [Tegillarca granosa]|uniref:NADP-dependent oxidoreductase domain-containing protein n=1 Tax=Tegillarca granosa TaxID=220873 RepID=A0ABQ9F329_TEGGR|nr:hypothetical protein KUTeg_012517 [Tegillarca granosa]